MELENTTQARSTLLEEFMTRDELATTLNVSARTLARWKVLRMGPPRVEVGRLILYRRAAVSEWLATMEKGSRRENRSAGRKTRRVA
jgi:hypothetical protein